MQTFRSEQQQPVYTWPVSQVVNGPCIAPDFYQSHQPLNACSRTKAFGVTPSNSVSRVHSFPPHFFFSINFSLPATALRTTLRPIQAPTQQPCALHTAEINGAVLHEKLPDLVWLMDRGGKHTLQMLLLIPHVFPCPSNQPITAAANSAFRLLRTAQ